MNIKKAYKAILLLPLTLLIGCADFLDVNESPNNPLDVPLNTLLPSALVATGFANANELNRFTSVTSDYLYGAGNAPANYDIYTITGTDFGNQWTGEIWNGGLIQYKKIIDKGEAAGAYSYVGIAKIMQAYMWSLTTDIWGDIPYTDALKGLEGITRPTLNTQEEIYTGANGVKSLFDLVREGIADLDKTSSLNPGTDDIVYGGNLGNWKKAGYTMMLKFATTISVKNPTLAKTVIDEVIAADGFIKANNENLSVKFGTAVGSQSPIFSYMFVTTFQNDMMVSSRYLNLLQDGANPDDPRLPLFVTRPSGSYVTFDNGFRGTLPAVTTFSKWAPAVTGTNGAGPIRLVTNAMRCFMLAEAVVRLGVTPPAGQSAQSLFYDGIRASMTEAGVATADINAYIGADVANVTAKATLSGTTDIALDQIITQKYIAMTGNGLEAYNDIRRTGFPSHTQPEHLNAAGEDGKRPVRARYPDAEIARNPNFVAKKTNEKIWWDAN